MSHREMER